jgi:hypothetical protein
MAFIIFDLFIFPDGPFGEGMTIVGWRFYFFSSPMDPTGEGMMIACMLKKLNACSSKKSRYRRTHVLEQSHESPSTLHFTPRKRLRDPPTYFANRSFLSFKPHSALLPCYSPQKIKTFCSFPPHPSEQA